MKQSNPLKFINPIVFALLAIQFITLPVMKFTGLHAVAELHEAVGLLFGASILVHLYFNRVWIINTFFKKGKS